MVAAPQLQVFDHDVFSAVEFLKFNFDEVVGAKELLGRWVGGSLPSFTPGSSASW